MKHVRQKLLKFFISESTLFFIFAACIFSFGYLVVRNRPLMVDENGDFPTIQQILSWNINQTVFSRTSVLPGYHFILAGIGKLFHATTPADFRLIHLAIACLAVVFFYALAKHIDKEHALIKTVQFLFLPLNFIFYFVLYTDVFSLCFLLASFLLLLKKHYIFSGIIALISLAIRQDNIFWIFFFYIFELFREYAPQDRIVSSLQHKSVATTLSVHWKNLLHFVKRMWLYEVSFIAMVGFILYFGGATATANNQHDHPISFHTDNIFFLLFILFVIFFPLHITNIKKIIKLLEARLYIIPVILLLLALYWFTFKADHFFNSPFTVFDFALRNKILIFARSSGDFNKYLFFLTITAAFLSLSVTRLKTGVYYLLYPITIILLATQWLVEPRYYIPAVSFFLLFRKYTNRFTEYAIIIVFAAVAIYLFVGSASGSFFP